LFAPEVEGDTGLHELMDLEDNRFVIGRGGVFTCDGNVGQGTTRLERCLARSAKFV
jgi:hypothetical protein